MAKMVRLWIIDVRLVALKDDWLSLTDCTIIKRWNNFKTGKSRHIVTLQIILEFRRKFGNNWSSSLDDYLKKLNDPLNMKKPSTKRMKTTTSNVDHHKFKTFGNKTSNVDHHKFKTFGNKTLSRGSFGFFVQLLICQVE